jgi:hypothetical protein
MPNTVTVTHHRWPDRYSIKFSQLPDRVFGRWDFARTVRDLTVSALLTPLDARNLVLDAHAHGSATAIANR